MAPEATVGPKLLALGVYGERSGRKAAERLQERYGVGKMLEEGGGKEEWRRALF